MSIGDEAAVDFATARGRDYPSVRQFNIFLANRLGAMLDLVRRFETSEVTVVSLTVNETADCAIIRLVPSDYERGYEVLQSAKLPFTESDLLLVKLPDNAQPLLTITKALLSGEVNLNYCYPRRPRRRGRESRGRCCPSGRRRSAAGSSSSGSPRRSTAPS